MPGQDMGTNNPRHYAKNRGPFRALSYLTRDERELVRGPRRLTGNVSRRVVFAEALSALVKHLLSMRLRRLHRRRRCLFSSRNSLASVG